MKPKPEPLVALVAGILILIWPDLIRWVLGVSLILVGVLGLMGRR